MNNLIKLLKAIQLLDMLLAIIYLIITIIKLVTYKYYISVMFNCYCIVLITIVLEIMIKKLEKENK